MLRFGLEIINRGISKSIRHLTALSAIRPLCQGVDLINNFYLVWSSKWLWPIIFSVGVVIATIELPTYAFNMPQRWPVPVGPQVFVIADIWICRFGRFVFVKPSLSHLQTSDKYINTCLGAVLDFSQNMFCIFRVLLSTFVSTALVVLFTLVEKREEKIQKKIRKNRRWFFKGFQHLCSSSSAPYSTWLTPTQIDCWDWCFWNKQTPTN